MKMVKSLLLSGAAGMVAVAGAQAADLPVKAKPVEYVKVCSLYGEGFFYIPGTDTCLKIGGMVRFDTYLNGASGSGGAANAGQFGLNDRVDTHDVGYRARTVASFDARTQTEYGTLRSYARFGFQVTSVGGSYQSSASQIAYAERAFIQFAGFTFGNTQSYFDFLSHSYAYSSFAWLGGADSGGGGTLLAAYTAQFGNGLSATISLEDNNNNRSGFVDASVNNSLLVNAITNDYGAQQVPDIVANFRIDQAWGSAQFMGALHQVRAGCFGVNGASGNGCVAPSDAWGWAAGAGVIINLPWNKGDVFFLEGAYEQGAVGYIGGSRNYGPSLFRFDGANVAFTPFIDGAFGGAGNAGIELSTGWDIYGGVEHYWTPALRTSVWGTYSQVRMGDGLNALLRQASASVTGGQALDYSFDIWAVGTRTVWQPVKNLDLGFEVLYGKLEPKSAGGNIAFAGSGGRPAGNYTIASEGFWSGMLRVQRNFWP